MFPCLIQWCVCVPGLWRRASTCPMRTAGRVWVLPGRRRSLSVSSFCSPPTRKKTPSSRTFSSLTFRSLRVTWTNSKVPLSRLDAICVFVVCSLPASSVASLLRCVFVALCLFEGYDTEPQVSWCQPESFGLQSHGGRPQWVQVSLWWHVCGRCSPGALLFASSKSPAKVYWTLNPIMWLETHNTDLRGLSHAMTLCPMHGDLWHDSHDNSRIMFRATRSVMHSKK